MIRRDISTIVELKKENTKSVVASADMFGRSALSTMYTESSYCERRVAFTEGSTVMLPSGRRKGSTLCLVDNLELAYLKNLPKLPEVIMCKWHQV